MNEILVTGASGQQGFAAIRHLLAAGQSVRAMLRDVDSATAGAMRAEGCQIVQGDFDQPDSLPAALEGVGAAFLVLPLSDKQTEIHRGRAFIQAAIGANLPYLLFSTALDADHVTGVAHFDSKYHLIGDLAESGLEHHVLGPGGFMENILYPETWQGVLNGELLTPFAVDVPQALVALDDIGRFASRCLLNPPVSSDRFLPLYSECLSSREQAEQIAQWLDRPVKAKQLPAPQTRQFMGPQLADMFDYFNQGKAPQPPDNLHFLQALDPATRFAAWLIKQTPPT